MTVEAVRRVRDDASEVVSGVFMWRRNLVEMGW